MKEEPWLQKIQERLKDYSEPVPPSGWQSLEKDLPLQRQMYANGRERQRLITLRRYAIVGAAAVLLAAISSVSVWLMHTPAVEGWQQAVSPAALVTVPDVLPSSPLPSSQGEDIVPGLQAKASPRPSTLLAAADDAEVAENASSDTDIPESGNEETYNNRQTDKAEAENGKRGAEPRRRSLPPSSTTDMFAMVNEAPKRRGWSVALSVGNVGGVGNMANDGGGTPTMQSSPNAYLGINLCSADAIVTVLEGREILYKEGMPYLAESRQIAHIDHRLPVSFGVTFRKNLPKTLFLAPSAGCASPVLLMTAAGSFARSVRRVCEKSGRPTVSSAPPVAKNSSAGGSGKSNVSRPGDSSVFALTLCAGCLSRTALSVAPRSSLSAPRRSVCSGTMPPFAAFSSSASTRARSAA